MPFLFRNSASVSFRRLPKAMLALPFVFVTAIGVTQAFAQIATGTVMASTGSGKVTEYSPIGTFLTQLDTATGAVNGTGYTTGSTFDSAGNFYVTDFDAQRVSKFDPNGFLVNAAFGGPAYHNPESIVPDAAGHLYAGQAGNVHNVYGQADGTQNVLKFDSTGILLATFSPPVEIRGTDWVDLGPDQCTLYYTSESVDILSFNVCTNTPGPNFNVAPLPKPAYAHRLRHNGEMLVADTSAVIRLSASGAQIQTYTLPVTSLLFALSLDPDGTSFWTADLVTGQVFRVDIASGTLITTFPANASNGASGFKALAGLSVKGENFASQLCIAGIPGQPNCHGKCVSELAGEFGGIDNASRVLRFSSVSALQNAIRNFCGS